MARRSASRCRTPSRGARRAVAGGVLLLASTAALAAPVVVELFTSQSCSSCPPAEALLSQLLASPPAGVELIALAEHVDYWDGAGWRDPYARHLFTARQQRYADDVFGPNAVYTPQLVVDGTRQVVGSDRAAVLAAINSAALKPLAPLHVTAMVDGVVVDVHVSGDVDPGDAHLVLALTEDGVHTAVRGGENAGRALTERAVVRHFADTGVPQAWPASAQLPVLAGTATRSVVALLQRADGRIIAAGQAPLREP